MHVQCFPVNVVGKTKTCVPRLWYSQEPPLNPLPASLTWETDFHSGGADSSEEFTAEDPPKPSASGLKNTTPALPKI